MRYVAAYLLCVLGGNSSPSKEDITKVLESVGLDIEDDRLDKVTITRTVVMGNIWRSVVHNPLYLNYAIRWSVS